MKGRAWGAFTGCILASAFDRIIHADLTTQLWTMLMIAIIGLSEESK